MELFVIALASDSAEDSDTVAVVTDQCRTVKHGPIANTPRDVGAPSLCVSRPSLDPRDHMDDVVELPIRKGNSVTHRWRPLR